MAGNDRITLIVIIAMMMSCYIAMKNKKMSIVARSSCFDHQVDSFLEVDGLNIDTIKSKGKGLYAVVIRRNLNKTSTESFHVGVLKINTFESRMKATDSFIQTEKGKGGTNLVIFSVGTSHEKGLVDEMKNGMISGEYTETADVLRRYGMKKFLSVAHGCRQPYVLIHDLIKSKTVSERTGACGGTLCSKT